MELEEFIKTHKGLVTSIFRSLHSKYLDNDDLLELQYAGLWKAWKHYKPGICMVNTYITHVIRNYAYSIIRKKLRWYKHEEPLYNQDRVYYHVTNPEEYYTDSEWDIMKHVYEGKNQTQITDALNTYPGRYKRLATHILQKRHYK